MLLAESKGLSKCLTVRRKLTSRVPVVDFDKSHFFELFKLWRMISAEQLAKLFPMDIYPMPLDPAFFRQGCQNRQVTEEGRKQVSVFAHWEINCRWEGNQWILVVHFSLGIRDKLHCTLSHSVR
jgi:hypothetical protein